MIGIVDALGIESFITFKGNENQAFIFKLRAKVNLQRNAIYYCLDFTNNEIEKINNLIYGREKQAFIEAGMIVTEKLDSLNKTSHTKTNKELYKIYKLRRYL